MGETPNEDDDLQFRQGRLYPVGCALRSTYDAENHDTLGADVTGLMIDLSKIPFEPSEPARTLTRPTHAAVPMPEPAPARAEAAPSLIGWLRHWVPMRSPGVRTK